MAVDLEQITNHETQALGRLATQYRDKPNIAKIVRIIARRAQALETVVFQVFNAFRIETAIGAQLDVLGRIVGQPRESAGDTEYRLRIKARIRANLSGGMAEDIYKVFDLLLPSHTLVLEPVYPASFVFEILGSVDPALVPLYRKFFYDTKAAGVYGVGLYSTEDPVDTFTLDDALSPTPNPDIGLDDALAPGTQGGVLAGVL
jgi:hypothetical protein